jgi:hypothetical protein
MPKRPTRKEREAQLIRDAQEGFTKALARIDNVLSFRLRHLRGERKEEAMEEGRALAWANWLQLARDGRDPSSFSGRLAQFAAQGVKSGHGVTGYAPINDVMSPRCRHRRGHSVQSISPPDDDEMCSGNGRSLRDHREPDPADEAQARIDHEERMKKWTPEQREIAEALASGMNSAEVGRERGVTRTMIWHHREAMKAALGAAR